MNILLTNLRSAHSTKGIEEALVSFSKARWGVYVTLWVNKLPTDNQIVQYVEIPASNQIVQNVEIAAENPDVHIT